MIRIRVGFPRAFVVLLLAIAAGCAAIHRPPTTVAALQAAASSTRAAYAATIGTILDGLAQRLVVRGDRTLDILLLSAGGQNGAYGAGFLRGWRSRTDEESMPCFDLVTGVSAGAMQAPFAILGTTEAFDESASLFRDAAKTFAPKLDWWSWLRPTGGIADVSAFRKTVDRVLDADLQSKLVVEFDANRHLVVTTTDFDLGVGRAWDLGREMGRTPGGLPRARSILMASSAIPGIFPPVIIDGHVHADGGVIGSVFVPLEFADYQALLTRARAAGITGDVTVRVWVVMNGWAYPKIDVTNPANRSGISSRALDLLLASQQPQIVDHLMDVARAASTGIPGLRVEVHATAIPAAMASDPGADKRFNDGWMHRLEQFGYDRARGAKPWDDFIAPYARPGGGHPADQGIVVSNVKSIGDVSWPTSKTWRQ